MAFDHDLRQRVFLDQRVGDVVELDVDLLEVRLRRAVEIVEELDRRIRGARERVGSLLPRLEAVGQDSAQEDEGR